MASLPGLLMVSIPLHVVTPVMMTVAPTPAKKTAGGKPDCCARSASAGGGAFGSGGVAATGGPEGTEKETELAPPAVASMAARVLRSLGQLATSVCEPGSR